MIPLQFARQTASGRAKSTNGSYLENFYVQNVPMNSETPQIVIGSPGTVTFGTLATYPALAGIEMAGVQYVVTATKLYSISSLGVPTEIGTINITSDRCTVATNGTYLCIAGGNGYYYSVAGGLNQFSGGAWNDCDFVRFLDGYFIFSATTAGDDLYFITGINDITLDAADQNYAESLPDAIKAFDTLNGECWFFGEDVTEVHYNSGDADFPIERRQGILIERGIIAPHTLVKEESLFWLGDDRIFYAAGGYAPIRISDHAVEETIAQGVVSDAFSFIYTEEGHKFIQTTFPTLSITWVYDLTTGLWHRRNHSQHSGRHHANCCFRAFNKNLVADYQNGNIYEMSLSIGDDDGDSIIRDAICPVVHANRERFSIKEIELKVNSGQVSSGVDYNMQMRSSKDGQNSWGNWKTKPIGKIGNYLQRVRFSRLGQARKRHLWFRFSENVPSLVIDGLWGDFG